MNHWAFSYIGTPWLRGASGPEAYDCLSFTAHVQARHYGVQLPTPQLPGENRLAAQARALQQHSQEADKWRRVDKPFDGAITLLARSRIPCHIGTWIRANNTEGVLHCVERIGVVFQTLPQLRGSGWGGLLYYERKN